MLDHLCLKKTCCIHVDIQTHMVIYMPCMLSYGILIILFSEQRWEHVLKVRVVGWY